MFLCVRFCACVFICVCVCMFICVHMCVWICVCVCVYYVFVCVGFNALVADVCLDEMRVLFFFLTVYVCNMFPCVCVLCVTVVMMWLMFSAA